MIAKDRGIRVIESRSSQHDDFTNLLKVTVKTTSGVNVLAGTVFGKNEPRLVRMNTFRLEAMPSGPMLFVLNKDVPGVIGALGTKLGSMDVNISRMTVGMEEEKGRNIILLNTNTVLTKDQVKKVTDLPHIEDAMVLDLPLYM
jgi:D-3-phosphoglycerate dehydrogenase